MQKKYNFKETEEKWSKYWQDENIYKFEKDNREIFSVDTPPPTVSGNIHIGHIFSYSQTEMITRFKRLMGFNVFYPFGFDNNGLATERLVEKELKIKATDFERSEFNKMCLEVSAKYEDEFKKLFNKMGFGCDWNLLYRTISPEVAKISQLSFLDLYNKNKVYFKDSPALWCSTCGTSFAQAELETKNLKGKYHHIIFNTEEDNEEFTIATTRIELLPAIVAVFVNPDDEKNKHLIGKTASIPAVDLKVPIMADELVDQEKGSGIVMSCTFGDPVDIKWFFKYKLNLRNILTKDGHLNELSGKYSGLSIKEAREAIVNDLRKVNKLEKEEEITHEVSVHERCGKPVDYNLTKQWFISVLDHKNDFLEIGEKVNWHPSYMRNRYDEWVNNLEWDWGISRQRFFGIPFPVWHCEECSHIIVATEDELPVNPLEDKPRITKCPKCNSTKIVGDKDVMDTWATSSVTPLINMKYKTTESLEDELKIMSLRPNASDIIRTWDFYTIVKSYYHFNEKPWKDVMISGFGMAAKGEKISKSKNNAKNDPFTLINEYSADVLRYWAGTGKLGSDIYFATDTLDRGKKLVNKLFNASKFINMHLENYTDKEFNDYLLFDKWILSLYSEMESEFIGYLNKYESGLALTVLEKFFWNFCDNYLEIVKHRLYRPEEFGEKNTYSAKKTLYIILYKLLQKFSIYFPFITEELYQKIYSGEKSIHLTQIKKLQIDNNGNKEAGNELLKIVSLIRGAKTNKGVSLKTEVEDVEILLDEKYHLLFKEALIDLKATLFINSYTLTKSDNTDIKNIKLKEN